MVTHTLRQTEIPTLLDSPDKNTLSLKISCPHKDNCFSSYCPKSITYLIVGLLGICEDFYFFFQKCVSVGHDNLHFHKLYGVQAGIKTLTCFVMCGCVCICGCSGNVYVYLLCFVLFVLCFILFPLCMYFCSYFFCLY